MAILTLFAVVASDPNSPKKVDWFKDIEWSHLSKGPSDLHTRNFIKFESVLHAILVMGLFLFECWLQIALTDRLKLLNSQSQVSILGFVMLILAAKRISPHERP